MSPVLLYLFSAASGSAFAQLVPRPPQFVALAFDGSQSLDMWNATREFTKDMKAQNKDVHFTYFISGVYFLSPKNKAIYKGPNHGVGHSDIGFGEDPAHILSRTDQVNLARQENHEIASHANGHFDGSKWTEEDWTSEFTQFNNLIFGAFQNNQISPSPLFPQGWTFNVNDIVGFRAPLLAYSKGLYATEKMFHYRYDTSQTAAMNYWPAKNADGQWNFPLAEVVIAGTGKHTLSMDYNFYYAQSDAKPNAANTELYEKQMYDTYMNYFIKNYNGNRAPVSIGHHFSQWNGGAYWRAMKHVAQTVCGLPEVKCGTYTELANFMDATAPSMRLAYVKGSFTKPATPFQVAGLQLPLNLQADVTSSGDNISVSLNGAHAAKVDPSQVEWSVNGATIARGLDAKLGTDQIPQNSELAMKVKGEDGIEILSRTFKVGANAQGESELSKVANEDRALQGDLPEAHTDEAQGM